VIGPHAIGFEDHVQNTNLPRRPTDELLDTNASIASPAGKLTLTVDGARVAAGNDRQVASIHANPDAACDSIACAAHRDATCTFDILWCRSFM
jgi:hypothetical protein